MPYVPKGMDKKLHRALIRSGWGHSFTSSGHSKYRPPPGAQAPDGTPLPILTAGCSPSDQRAVRNFRATLRRLGIDLKEK